MSEYPHVSYHFSVEWGGTRIGFNEVSGLETEVDVINYREGSFKDDSFRKLPGLHRNGPITLKRGFVKDDHEFFEWYKTISMGQVERRDVLISMLDENHEPVIRWKLRNSFPRKVQWSTLKSDQSEVLIETLVLVHEGLMVE